MKYLIASDIHGSKESAKRIVELFYEERADLIILLGDLYNHGPRNGLYDEYDPMEVASIFNDIKSKLIVVKGNCDSEVDEMISDFDFNPALVLDSNGKSIFLTHGHVFNIDNPPKTKYDALIYGHFHTGYIERNCGIVFANTGSTTLPKNGTPKSYIILEKGKITLKTLEKIVIKEESM